MDKATKTLILNLADDNLIIGHRHSEWTGLGPILEEDIAFSSIAQDKIGQSYQLYRLLDEGTTETDPDQVAFMRDEKDYTCAQLVEYPNGEYDHSLVRHFYFDHAQYLRFMDLKNSSNHELSLLANKFVGEIKYHLYHANTWIKQLMEGTEESKARIKSNLQKGYKVALGMFESFDGENELINSKVYSGENAIKEQWNTAIKSIVQAYGIELSESEDDSAHNGGRKGFHTEHLKPLLDEMQEVFQLDPAAEW